MQERQLTYSPGAIAERLGVSMEVAQAAIKAAGLLDHLGRPKRWLTDEDLPAIRAQIPTVKTSSRPQASDPQDEREAEDPDEPEIEQPPPPAARRRRGGTP